MSDNPPQPRRHRPALMVLVGVAAVVCLAMAWWQWDRYESAAGTAQNLGYALQWPAFALAFIWAYRRFVVLESDPDEVANLAPTGMTEIPDGVLPERPATPSAASLAPEQTAGEDQALTEYNRYLAELDQATAAHAPGTPDTDIRREDQHL
ncbi:hypothetical protein GCM10009624_07580 [Gordonia sinesedis]